MFKIVRESFSGSSKSFQDMNRSNRKIVLIMGWIGFAAIGFFALTSIFSDLIHKYHLFALVYFVVVAIYCFVMVVLSTQYDI